LFFEWVRQRAKWRAKWVWVWVWVCVGIVYHLLFDMLIYVKLVVVEDEWGGLKKGEGV
jgi:hypothetical protein